MMPTGKINKKTDEVAPSSLKDVLIWHADLRGFGLKITPSGTRTYVVQ
jgi:hypothetical protein